MSRAIETERLTKIFGHQNPAVSNLSISVPEGSCYGFLGPNGAGKTTTIKMLLGLVLPTAGKCGSLARRWGPTAPDCAPGSATSPRIPSFPHT